MQTNQQAPEKQTLDSRGIVSLHHIFPTIQGEGPCVGMPAVFVRLAGCNLQCPLCDTDYTSKRQLVGPAYIVDAVKEMQPPGRLVVITGGEPFRQNIGPLVRALIDAEFRVQIETNGTLFVPDLPYGNANLLIVCSPKTGTINRNLAPHVDALKYVIHADQVDGDDGLPRRALNHPAAPRLARPPQGFSGPVYVQPTDEQDELQNRRHLDATIRSVLKHGYTLCLQTHKIINME
jgi:7-carboxy-7-deazaguanine synthase